MVIKPVAVIMLGVASGVSGCAHPFLKAGSGLATAIQKGDTALSAITDAEANTQRIYKYVQPYSRGLGVKKAEDLDSEFVGEVCRPHAKILISEHIAIDNLDKFQADLNTNSTDPKDTSLGALVAALSSPTSAKFKPTDFGKAATEYQAKKAKDFDKCSSDVRTTFVATPPAGALTDAVVLAAWPKIKDFLTVLLTEANKEKREAAIIALLSDSDATKTIDDSLTVLTDSVDHMRLYELAVSQKQLALWSAYSEFIYIKNAPTLNPVKLSAISPPCGLAQADYDRLDNDSKSKVCVSEPVKEYSAISESAKRMSSDMKTYDDLAGVDLKAVVKTMADAIHKLQTAAKSGKAPGDSVLTELLAAIDLLSDASGKYSAAASALNPTSSTKKK